jgi:hypothetical protein
MALEETVSIDEHCRVAMEFERSSNGDEWIFNNSAQMAGKTVAIDASSPAFRTFNARNDTRLRNY